MTKTLPEGVDAEALSGIIPDADLMRLMDGATSAPEPGFNLQPQELLHRGDEEVPATMVTKVLQSAGYVIVYSTETGEPSLCNRNMLPAQLRKRNDKGAVAFTTRKPNVAPHRGTIRCLLHADRREPMHDEMGLPTCPKANLTSDFQVRMHMQRRHKSAWDALEEIRLRNEREETLAVQRAMLAAVANSASITSELDAEPTPERQAMLERMAKARAARGK